MSITKQDRFMSLEEAMSEVGDKEDRTGAERMGEMIKTIAMSRLE